MRAAFVEDERVPLGRGVLGQPSDLGELATQADRRQLRCPLLPRRQPEIGVGPLV
jgi:hypothetical protein